MNAVRQVLAEDSKGKGVTVTLNSYINAARYVRKTHTSNVQTFTSGDAGALGYVDEDRVVYYYTSPIAVRACTESDVLIPGVGGWR